MTRSQLKQKIRENVPVSMTEAAIELWIRGIEHAMYGDYGDAEYPNHPLMHLPQTPATNDNA